MEENKFNFSDGDTDKIEESKEEIVKEAKGLFVSLSNFLIGILSFQKDTDRDATVEAIKNDITFKGATAWILICSIFVASIGLNYNSTAVVIGAMLISPLMGPILGIGMSLAVNDIDVLKKSLINFGVMIVLSILTAYLFFEIFPLRQDSSELIARTRPDIRDVLIAFFGGSALIIAKTKKGTIASVIFGVAIATALMPPLCTVGYGLAKGFEPGLTPGSTGYSYALGALYLFTINTIFIALATFLVLKLLRFPMMKYANSKKRRFIGRLATLLAVVVMIPALWTFISVLKETNFERDARKFLKDEINSLPHADFIRKNAEFNYKDGDSSYILLNTFGLDEIPLTTEAILNERMKEYNALKNAKLIIPKNKIKNIDNLKYMEQIRYRDSIDLFSQTQKINFLEDELGKMQTLKKLQIPLDELVKEVKINYEAVKTLSFAVVINSNFKTLDTVSVFGVKWNDSLISNAEIPKKQKQLEDWLKVKYKLDSMVVRREN
jgi:uncharacterized hydrophobic protein (TIGR00271 family)